MAERLVGCLTESGDLLFMTAPSGLFATYLATFPADVRQHFNCHACQHFIEHFGGLVTISADGTLRSPFWQIDASDEYTAPFAALARKVMAAQVTGVFYHDKALLGTPESGGWTHLAATLPATYSTRHKRTLTPAQAMAEKREDYATVMRALDEFSADDVAQAVRVLKSEALYRSEHLMGAAEWLAALHAMRRATTNRQTRQALMWRAVAVAPAGFCHPRSGVLGTLLEDIQAGLPFDDIKARFDAKMHPLQYQRPQAAPTAATIAQAEKLVEQMGIAGALKRRFARLDEIETIWRPATGIGAGNREGDATTGEGQPQGGVFAHLTPKGQRERPALELPPTTMTWDKFRRTVLPEAEAIEFRVPPGFANYAFLTTASDPDAPPILQWDTPERRNPVAWYVYNGGCMPDRAGLTGGACCAVTAITLQPTLWGDRLLAHHAHHGESVIFCLEGCRDVRNDGGLALFPETLKAELHGVRSVIEAHSRSGRLDEPDGPLACGIRLQKGMTDYGTFRVRAGGQWAPYRLDRWD